LQKTGATWIANHDYRTYAMLRWYFKDRVPVIQINERGRFLGFRDPGMNSIGGHTGLYVAREPDIPIHCGGHDRRSESRSNGWSEAGAESQWIPMPWRKLTNWTPELSPRPDSPLFRWRVLAGDLPMLSRVAAERCHSRTVRSSE